MRRVFLLAFAALLPACTVGPDYAPPEAGLPGDWSERVEAPPRPMTARGGAASAIPRLKP